MKPIYTYFYQVTSKNNFDGRITTFESIFKNEREISKFMKQIDSTLISSEVISQGACIGYKGVIA